MPQKPDKFGIKFWLLSEVDSKYLINGFPYLGKDDLRPPNRLLGEHVILELCSPFYGKGYNITCDNFFTTQKLVIELQKKKTSLVGTIRSNKKELPVCACDLSKPVLTTDIFKNKQNNTLTVYTDVDV